MRRTTEQVLRGDLALAERGVDKAKKALTEAKGAEAQAAYEVKRRGDLLVAVAAKRDRLAASLAAFLGEKLELADFERATASEEEAAK